MKKIYISGPMRGRYRNNFPAFDAAAIKLDREGFETYNPAQRDRQEYGTDVEFWGELTAKEHGFDIRNALGTDLEWICRHGDAIAMLPGWENSRGAKAEWALAVALGLEIRYL